MQKRLSVSGLTFQAPLVSVGGHAVGGHSAWPWVKVCLLGQAFAGGKEVTQVGGMGRNGHRPSVCGLGVPGSWGLGGAAAGDPDPSQGPTA